MSECEYDKHVAMLFELWARDEHIKALKSDVDTLKAENDRLMESVGLINVKDRLPDERCLAYTPTDNEEHRWRIIPKGLFKQAATEATHWMPLPEPPEDKP